jgi:hypothetical protein
MEEYMVEEAQKNKGIKGIKGKTRNLRKWEGGNNKWEKRRKDE